MASVPHRLIELLQVDTGMSNFVRVDKLEMCKNGDLVRFDKQTVIENLQRVLMEEMTRQGPCLVPPKRHPGHLTAQHAMAFNQRYFAILEIQRLKMKQLDELSTRVVSIINFLDTDDLRGVCIVVEEQRMVQETMADTPEIRSLRAVVEHLTKRIEEFEESLNGIEAQKKILSYVFDAVDGIFDDNMSFLLSSPCQDKFETVFEYEGCELSKDLNLLVSQPYDKSFTGKVIELMQKTIRYFELPSSVENVLCLMLYRLAYDKLYAFGNSPLRRTDVSLADIDRISTYLRSASFEVLCPPDDMCPEHQPEDNVGEVFRKCQLYEAAIDGLRMMQFEMNPIDALNCARQALHGIRTVHIDRLDELSFDVVFGLFVAVAAAAEIPELPVYSDFVNQCAPDTGLSWAFDFAHAKLNAAIAYLRDISLDGKLFG